MTPTPSDDAADVLRQGRTDVVLGVLSLSARSPEGRDAEYLAWHGLDHLPEQYRIPEVRLGRRFVSTQACRAARAASAPVYDAVDHAVQYLFAEPTGAGLDAFFALGAALGAAGRMPLRLPAVALGVYELAGRAAAPRALVGADVLPWRPSTGAYLLLERRDDDVARPSTDDLVAVEGVAGAWWYRGPATRDERFADTTGLDLTVCYLEGDVVPCARRLADVLPGRWRSGEVEPLLAAPFETVVPFAWDRHLPAG